MGQGWETEAVMLYLKGDVTIRYVVSYMLGSCDIPHDARMIPVIVGAPWVYIFKSVYQSDELTPLI